MVSWIPNNGGPTRQVTDNNMFMPHGFFFFGLGKIVTCDFNKKKCAKKFLLVTINKNELEK